MVVGASVMENGHSVVLSASNALSTLSLSSDIINDFDTCPPPI